MRDEKRAISATTDGQPARPGFENASAPAPVNPRTGQHEAYWVLSPEERAKGFVRPVRRSYRHVGQRVCGKPKADAAAPSSVCVDVPGHDGECAIWRGATDAEFERHGQTGHLGGCDTVTTMGQAIAETYARDPRFYSGTFCVSCREHFPLDQFVWAGTNERVGS